MNRDKFKEGVELFNTGRFFEAHEAWEEIWLKDKESLEGRFLIGLIQYAAFLLKVKQCQKKPALTLGKMAIKKLEAVCKQASILFDLDLKEWLPKAKTFFEKFEEAFPTKEEFSYPKLNSLQKAGSPYT